MVVEGVIVVADGVGGVWQQESGKGPRLGTDVFYGCFLVIDSQRKTLPNSVS